MTRDKPPDPRDTPAVNAPPRRVVPPDARRDDWRMPRPVRKVARAFAEALFADDQGPPPADRLDWLMEDVQDFLAHAGPRARTVFQASMVALGTVAPLAAGIPKPLWAIGWRERVHVVEKFEKTPLGLAVLGAKTMICFSWYEHPDTTAEIGYDGLPLDPRRDDSETGGGR